MTEKKRILQPVNLIVFLIFALTAGVAASLPLFEGANVFLQVGWTCYLLLGMAFLFFVGGKLERVKIIEKYLIDSKIGRAVTSCFLFCLCMGAGVAFRIWEMVRSGGAINKNTIYYLVYYLIVGVLVYFTARQISGFRGSVAAVILMALCPFFDFSAKLPVKECIYTLLALTAIFSISLANYFVERKSVSLQDTLLTVLGAISLAGATFLHISAIILLFPCVFLLIRRSGAAVRGKREQRGLRSLLFEVFYICSLVVIFLVDSIGQHTQAVNIPIDFPLFYEMGSIGKESMRVLTAFFDKFSGLFAINDPKEYYNGLLMGMLILGITGAILLFRKKAEKRYFPVYLFNWYFFFCILLKESAYSGWILFALLAYMTAGTMEDLSELIFVGKQEKQGDPAVAEEVAETEEEASVNPTTKGKTEILTETQEEASVDPTTKGKTEILTETPTEILTEPVAAVKKEEVPPEPVVVEKKEEAQPEPVVVEKKEEAQPEPVVVEEREEAQPEPVVAEEREEEQSEPVTAHIEEPESEAEKEEKKQEMEAARKEADEKLPQPEMPIQTEEREPEPEPEGIEENPLEKQIEDMIKREGRIMEIVEKQNTRISKLEEELREQRIRTKQMERHYRKELAVTRNKKR